MKRLLMVGVIAFGAASVRAADTYTLKNEVSGTVVDFTEPANFKEGACPQEGDILAFEKGNMSFTVTDATIGGFAKLSEVKFQYGCAATIDIEENHEIPTALGGKDPANTYYCFLYKKGSGELTLTSAKLGPTLYYDYYCDIHVQGGKLNLPGADIAKQLVIAGLTIDEGCAATAGLWGNIRLQVYGLNGAGDFTVQGHDESPLNLLSVWKGSFSGKLTGRFELHPEGPFNLLGTENGFSGSIYNHPGTLGVQSFGNGGDSSIGHATDSGMTPIWFRSATTQTPGALLYLGEGEETSRILSFSDASKSATVFPRISGGEHGGLVFATNSIWETRTTVVVFPQKLVLDGSGEKPCVMRGKLKLGLNDDKVPVPFYLMKEGSGTWAMEGDKDYMNTWVVKDGTLRFDSLEERGIPSALGDATACTEAPIYPTAPAAVDYAFRLGDEGTTGMLEYTGTNLVFCTTRPVELVGNGGFKNDSPVPFRFDGIRPVTEGDKTFYLDGASTNENEIAGLVDADDRKVSIVKNGTGTWTLNGSNEIRGTITVNAGKLTIRKDKPKYSWFKFLIRGNYAGDTTDVRISEIAFSDASGKMLQTKLSFGADEIPSIQPGQAAFVRHQPFCASPAPKDLGNLFNGSYKNCQGLRHCRIIDGKESVFNISPSNPAGWIPLVMRFPEETAEVASYDVETIWGVTKNANYMLRNWTLFGSYDGIHWDVLDVKDYVNDNDMPQGTYTWYSGAADKTGTCGVLEQIPGHRATDPTFTVLDHVTEVSVAKDATLEVVGTETAPVISNLVVSAAGAGRIDGFAFAENGTISLTDDPLTEQSLRVAWDFSKASGVANLSNWKVLVNGVEKKRALSSVDETGGTFTKPGFFIIFR